MITNYSPNHGTIGLRLLDKYHTQPKYGPKQDVFVQISQCCSCCIVCE